VCVRARTHTHTHTFVYQIPTLFLCTIHNKWLEVHVPPASQMFKKISMLCWLQFLHNTFHSFQEINVTCKITWNKDSIILLQYHHISAGKYTHKLHSNLCLNSRNRCNYSVINDFITDGTSLIHRNFKTIICNATRTTSNSFQRWHSICWTYSLFLTMYPTRKRTLQQ